MMYTKIPFTAALMAAVAHSQRLDKVALVGSLDYLQAGLMANMPSVPSTQTQWSAGWIPADCKFLTENAGLSAQDVETFEVTYQDVCLTIIQTFDSSSLTPTAVRIPMDPVPPQGLS